MQKFMIAALCGTVAGAVLTTQVAGPLIAQEAARTTSVYEQLDLFGDIFERIRGQYVEEVETDKLVEAAINGMLTSLDPHSSYMAPDDFADMQVQTRGEFGGLGIDVTRAPNRDAEFVVFFAGGNLFVGARINIGVHADGDGGNQAKTMCDLRQSPQFGFRFHIKLPDATFQRQAHFRLRLANTGKYNAIPRYTRRFCAQIFTSRYHIHASPQIAQRFQNGDVGQRLDGKTHKVRQR